MKKILNFFIVFILSFVVFSNANQVYAAQCSAPISGVGVTLPEGTTSHTITIDLSSNFDIERQYWFELEENLGQNQAQSQRFRINGSSPRSCNSDGCVTVNNGFVTWEITAPAAFEQSGSAGSIDTKYVDLNNSGGPGANQCDIGTIDISDEDSPGSGCTIQVYQNRNGQQCYLNQSASACFANGIAINVKVSGLKNLRGEAWNGTVGLAVAQIGIAGEADGPNGEATNGGANLTFTPNSNSGAEYEIQVEDRDGLNQKFLNCKFRLTTQQGCSASQCEPETTLEVGGVPTAVAQEAFSLCKQIPEEFTDQRYQCEQCTGGTGEYEGNAGVWTAVGCIKRDPESILQRFIKVGLGISGGVALLTFLAAGFIFSTSQGDPKAYGKAKEMMTAAIVGIIFVIFSVTMLQFIGYEIFKIPGFGG